VTRSTSTSLPSEAIIRHPGLVQDLSELYRRGDAQRRGEHAAKLRRIHGAVFPSREW
jgi:hypothetical protein